jgi:hypothetical protein
MKTVLITGKDPVPAALRALVARASTSVAQHTAADVWAADTPDLYADGEEFWTAGAEPHVRRLAEQYARAEAAERREILVYVRGGAAGGAVAGLSSNEQYVWPADEDRLKMAFLTGA